MLSSVEDSPVCPLRISPGKESVLAFCIKRLENLPMVPSAVPQVSSVDLGPAENAQLRLHGDWGNWMERQ